MNERINRSDSTVYYPLTVNGEMFASDHLTIKCGDGTAVFDPETNTLTLDNATVTKYAKVSPSEERRVTNDGVIESRLDDLTIVLKGTNVMKWAEPNIGVVGNGIDQLDPPVGNAAVHDLGGGLLLIQPRQRLNGCQGMREATSAQGPEKEKVAVSASKALPAGGNQVCIVLSDGELKNRKAAWNMPQRIEISNAERRTETRRQ